MALTYYFKLLTQTENYRQQGKLSHDENLVVALFMLCIKFSLLVKFNDGGLIRASTKKIGETIGDRVRILYLLFLWFYVKQQFHTKSLTLIKSSFRITIMKQKIQIAIHILFGTNIRQTHTPFKVENLKIEKKWNEYKNYTSQFINFYISFFRAIRYPTNKDHNLKDQPATRNLGIN